MLRTTEGGIANNNFGYTNISNGPHSWRRQIHRGWVEAQNGRPWPDAYEVMTKSEQIAYEQGRLLAFEAKAAKYRLPFWSGDKAGGFGRRWLTS